MWQLHRYEQRGTGCQEEDYDGRWCMYLLGSSRTSSASLLRSVNHKK